MSPRAALESGNCSIAGEALHSYKHEVVAGVAGTFDPHFNLITS